MFKTQIKGLTKVLRELEKFGEEADKEVDIATFATAKDIELDAKSLAPVDKGFLRQQIATEKVEDKNYKVQANAPYSAFMEFGTGGLVEVPNEMKDIATQFKGKGIKKINISPQPFLYPAYLKNKETYVKDLDKALNRLVKKYS